MKVIDCTCTEKQADNDCEIVHCPDSESDICRLACRKARNTPIEIQHCHFKCAAHYQYKQYKNSEWKDCLPSISNWPQAMAKYYPTHYAIRITDDAGVVLFERIRA